jgi:tetratricopeptide (TPR) repeat protein
LATEILYKLSKDFKHDIKKGAFSFLPLRRSIDPVHRIYESYDTIINYYDLGNGFIIHGTSDPENDIFRCVIYIVDSGDIALEPILDNSIQFAELQLDEIHLSHPKLIHLSAGKQAPLLKDFIAGLICYFNSRIDKSQFYFQNVIEALNSKRVDDRKMIGYCNFFIGNLNFRQNEHQKAIESYEKAKLIVDITDEENEMIDNLLINQSISNIILGNTEDALKGINEAKNRASFEANDNDIKNLVNTILSHVSENDNIDPVDSTHTSRASSKKTSLSDSQNKNKTTSQIEKESQLDTMKLLGVTSFNQGNYELAIEAFLYSYLSNKTGEVASYLGRSYYEIGDLSNARRYYNHALKLNTLYETELGRLGWCYFASGRTDSAYFFLNSAYQRLPADYDANLRSQVILRLGHCFLVSGKTDKAAEFYKIGQSVADDKRNYVNLFMDDRQEVISQGVSAVAWDSMYDLIRKK